MRGLLHMDKNHFTWKKKLHKEEKTLLNFTHDFCHLTSSFGNKSFMALDWFSKSKKHFRYLLNCDQGERIYILL